MLLCTHSYIVGSLPKGRCITADGKNICKKHFDPIEAIKIRTEEMQLKQKDLAGIIGGKRRVSEILNRKKKLTVKMVRNLARCLNLSAQLLINDYNLTNQTSKNLPTQVK